MDNLTDAKPAFDGPALWSYGFRPFFLGAALFAAFAVPVWILILSAATDTELAQAARHWHILEMIFGFLPAVMAGFLLTALPSWTDRPPMRGMALAPLFALWCAGRGVMALQMFVPVPSIVVDSGFLVVLAGIAWREILTGHMWSRAPIAGLITLYAAANVASHVLRLIGSDSDLAERMGLSLVMILLALIGGRIIPAFTSEWLAEHRGGDRLPPFSIMDGLSLTLVAMAAFSWTIAPESGTTGWILLAAGCAALGRLSRWRGWRTWEEPLVLILHVGYAWLGMLMIMLGAAVLETGLSPEDAVHALMTGAVGAMTLGVMTRASLGPTGSPRHAGAITVLIYVCWSISEHCYVSADHPRACLHMWSLSLLQRAGVGPISSLRWPMARSSFDRASTSERALEVRESRCVVTQTHVREVGGVRQSAAGGAPRES